MSDEPSDKIVDSLADMAGRIAQSIDHPCDTHGTHTEDRMYCSACGGPLLMAMPEEPNDK